MANNNQLHIVAVTGFVYRKKDRKFLILKRSEKEVQNPGEWTVPGGKVEGKESMLDTLKREVKEEADIELFDDFQFIGDTEFTRNDGSHVIVPRFICMAKSTEVVIDKKDFSDYAWVGLDEIEKYALIPGVKEEFEILREEIRN